MRQLPFDREFDVVGAFDVLEHIPEDDEAMACLARAAKPGGGLVLTVPQHPALWSPVDFHSGHQRRHTRRALVALVRSARLEVIRITSFVSLLLPGLLASRLAQRRVELAPGREFDVSGRINRFASAVMGLERALITSGCSLPVGGSLLLVARRM